MRLRSSARRPYPDVPQPSQEVGSAPSRARSTRGTTAPPSLVSSRAPPSSVPATTISGPSTTTATALPAPSSSSAHAPSIGSQAVDTSTANGRHWGSGSFAIHLSTSATPISSTTDIPPIHSPRPAVLPTVEAETRAGTPFQLSLTICAIPSRCVRVHREGNGGMEIMLSNGLLSGKRKCRLGVANTRPSSRPSRKRRAKTTSGRLDSNDIHIQWRRQCGRLLMSRTKTKSSTRLGAKAQAQGERAAAANDETTPTSPHNESQSGGVPAPLPRQERDEVDDDLEAVERALLIEPSSMTRDTSAAAALPLFQSVTSHIHADGPVQTESDTTIISPPSPPLHIGRYIRSLCDARTLTREVRRYLISHPAFSTDYDVALRDLLNAKDWNYLPPEHRPTSLNLLKSIATSTRQRIISIHASFLRPPPSRLPSITRPGDPSMDTSSYSLTAAIHAPDQHTLLRVLYYIDLVKRPVDHVAPEEAWWIIRIGMNKGHILSNSLEVYARHARFVDSLIHCHELDGGCRCFHLTGHMSAGLAEDFWLDFLGKVKPDQ